MINFLITALVIFVLIKSINAIGDRFKKKEEEAAPAAPTTKICPYCKSEIAIEATRCVHWTSVLDEQEYSIKMRVVLCERLAFFI